MTACCVSLLCSDTPLTAADTATSTRVAVQPVSATAPASPVASIPYAVSPEICSPLAGRTPAPFPVQPTQPESTRRMIQRVNEAFANTPVRSHPCLSEQGAAELFATLQSLGRAESQDLKPIYADYLLRAGDPERALRQLADWEKLLRENGVTLNDFGFYKLSITRALCHLRIGEQENCLLNPTTDSCLFPIQGSGVHQQTRGSRAAIAELTEILLRVPDQLTARWLLNVAHMTLGEYPDKVYSRWLIPPEGFASEYPLPRYPDIAGQLGLAVDDLAGGVVMEDFDSDGHLDLMVSSSGFFGQLRVFRNLGDGRFQERTVEAQLSGIVASLNLVHADYNNDGHPDVLVLRGGWEKIGGRVPNSLLRNNGDFTFTDVTEEAGLLRFSPTQTATFFDFDGDGALDLFIGNEATAEVEAPSELYRNNGDGTFTECAAQVGIRVTSFVKGVTSGDYNGDGRPDLFISRREGKNLLYRNDGPAAGAAGGGVAGWKFTEVAAQAGVADEVRGFPCWFWDYNNDGWQDLMVTGYHIRTVGDVAADYLGQPSRGAKARLYRNNGDGSFSDVSEAAGVSKVLHAMGVNFGDLDNDGWLDLYLGTGDPDLETLIPNRMFRNDAGRRFQDVTTAGGFGVLQKGHGIAFGDLNGDGAQEIYHVVGGAYGGDNYRNMLFANPGNDNRWLKLQLVGTRSNRSAIGARVKIVTETDGVERAIFSTVGTGASFGSGPLRREIGLGAADRIVRVEVAWPTTGEAQVFEGVEPNAFYRVREGQSELERLPLQRFAFAVQNQQANAPVTASVESGSR